MIAAALLLALGAAPPACPTIVMIAGADAIGTIFFYVTIDRIPAPGLTYRWSASAGRITDGQGTRGINVTVGLEEIVGHAVPVTAAVEIGGLPKGCRDTFIGYAEIGPFLPIPDRRVTD